MSFVLADDPSEDSFFFSVSFNKRAHNNVTYETGTCFLRNRAYEAEKTKVCFSSLFLDEQISQNTISHEIN